MEDVTDPVYPIDDPLPALRERVDVLERELASTRRDTEQRLLWAELKAEAIRAGMVDLDGLKLLDISGFKMTGDGTVEGAAHLMGQFRKSKPWLFSGPSSSSATGAPPPQQPRHKHATEMTDAEYEAARTALLKHRG